MSQYIIIGGDGREYGPKEETEVREWIQQGRLNALSQIKEVGEDEWVSLGSRPEFAVQHSNETSAPPLPSGPVGAPGGIPQAPVAVGNAQAMVNGPGIFMMVLAIICIPLTLLGLAMNLFAGSLGSILKDLPPELADQLIRDGAIGIAQNGLSLVANIAILIGAIKMRKCQSYGLAMTASILCILCDWGCCCLGLGAGIWSLVVLSKPEVKAAFQSA